MATLPLKPIKWPKYPLTLKNDWNIQNLKITKIPSKPKKNDRDTLENYKMTKISLETYKMKKCP